VIRWKSFGAGREASLCASCVGNRAKRLTQPASRAFCHLVRPNGLVLFPVRECTGYADRRVPGACANAKSTDRRFGFVTTLALRKEEPEPINDSEAVE
jgi:hypothetical protein